MSKFTVDPILCETCTNREINSEMYEALEHLYYLHSSGAFTVKDEDYVAIAKAAAAIAKAEGRQPE